MIELNQVPLLNPSEVAALASQLDALHSKAIKTIERLNKDVATRKAEIANRWKNSGVSPDDQAKYAENELRSSVLLIRQNAEAELDKILKDAGVPHGLLVGQRQFYSSAVQVLSRAGLGSEERSRYTAQLSHAGASELAHMAQLAVSTKNEALAAAVLGQLDRLPTKDRAVSPRALADAMNLDAYKKVGEYLKLGDARLQGILIAIRTWKQGRANPLDSVALALRERGIERDILGELDA